MKAFNIILLIVFLKSLTFSQSFFSVIPDFGGDDMEGRLYNVIPLENEIKLIGLVHDSLVPGFEGGTWPVLGTMSYNGNHLGSTLLIDSVYSDGFYYFTRRLSFKNDSICYIYDRRDVEATFLDAYLIEMNIRNGKILRSKIIYDQISNNEVFEATDLTIGKKGDIYLVNITDEVGLHPQVLTVLDSNLIVKSQNLIPDYGRHNITKYTEEDPDGNLVLVGVSLGQPNSVWFESKLFRQVLDKNYNSIDFKLAPTILDQSIIFLDYYPIIKAKSGDWIIASQVVRKTSDCPQCSIRIPYIVCVSSDFTEVRWETRLFDGNINSSLPEYNANSIAEVSDGYILAGSSDGMFGLETSGLLGKVSLDGDSLWLKHIVPIEWDTNQGRWFKWQDIKTTPMGNIVIGGFGSDRYTSRILPWVLQLDMDGCLEPGCSTTAISNELDTPRAELNIFPNPASNHCAIHIHTQINSSPGYELRIVNDEGRQLYMSNVQSGDVQYLIDLKKWPQGVYVVQLVDKTGGLLSKKLVVLK
ncbi:MAG TPA: T9SS type A sorting domain-containing protein [Saprospiraceae bacterium]|nr:T9SS type A sorting domain-containing protein [Saprospiraceae bacterium]